jgi:cation transport regulator ChaC
MKLSRIKSRTPSAKPIERAKIYGKRLAFNKLSKNGSGKANLVDDAKAETWGVIFEIEKKEMDSLDKRESGYQRMQVEVVSDDGNLYVAETYIALGLDDKLQPYNSYKTMILEGANEFGLPQIYIDGLTSVLSIPDPKSKSK